MSCLRQELVYLGLACGSCSLHCLQEAGLAKEAGPAAKIMLKHVRARGATYCKGNHQGTYQQSFSFRL